MMRLYSITKLTEDEASITGDEGTNVAFLRNSIILGNVQNDCSAW